MHRPVRWTQIGGTNSVGVEQEYQETGSFKRRWRKANLSKGLEWR